MTGSATSPIVICADDFGLSSGVSAGIIELITLRRLSATGAMTGLPGWRRHGDELARLVRHAPADVGLHLTLTGQRPISRAQDLAANERLPSIGTLTRAALTRTLPLEAVRAEVKAQLDAFEDVWGAPPDFLDGHQHCHILPGIRRVVIEELSGRYGTSPWLRSCGEKLQRAARRTGFAKAAVIDAFNTGLRARAARSGLTTNDSFRGFYDFSDRVPYAQVFRGSIVDAAGSGRVLVHCHPGRVDAELVALDPLTTPREGELAYLASAACGEDLARAGVRPARFSELTAA
ncbi:ChbG/HpnK family deacetylase [Ancylobacter sonchi]|uniref:ChbG/HpnK family deacetylase n=1 Tax=Ancylobacter sonchi TaxID=1937790 RepID=UPI0028B26519|nr:ChbG/HpnK family deacetylase [Ancylobacter sonchi]